MEETVHGAIARTMFELTESAPDLGMPGVRAIYCNDRGHYVIEREAAPSGTRRAAAGRILYIGDLVDVDGAWFEGSEASVSLCRLSLDTDRQWVTARSARSLLRGVCAQRIYAAARSAPDNSEAMLILHWTPQRFFTEARPGRDEVHSRLERAGLHVRWLRDFGTQVRRKHKAILEMSPSERLGTPGLFDSASWKGESITLCG